MYKKIARGLLCLLLVMTSIPLPVLAEQSDVSTTSQGDPLECICTEMCQEDNLNPDCPVCFSIRGGYNLRHLSGGCG